MEQSFQDRIQEIDVTLAMLKSAFQPTPPAAPPGAPPMGPAMMGGAPPPGAPMDPSMMGGAPPGAPVDPSMMGAAPPPGAPMDPSMGGAPAPGGGGIPPELESSMAEIMSVIENLAGALEQGKRETANATAEARSSREEMIELRARLDMMEKALKSSSPLEGNPMDSSAQAIPAQDPLMPQM